MKPDVVPVAPFEMTLNSKTSASRPRIIVFGSELAALERLRAQIELRGFLGCVEVRVSPTGTPAELGPDTADLVVWKYQGNAAPLEGLPGDVPVVLVCGDVPAPLPPPHICIPAACRTGALIDAIGDFVSLPWPDKLLKELRSNGSRSDAEQRYLDLFYRSNDPILLIESKTNVIVAANSAAERLYDCPNSDLVGLYMLSLVDPAFHLDVYRNCVAIREGHQSHDQTARQTHLRRDGSGIPVSVSAALVSYGPFQTFQIIVRDETAQIQREERLKSMVAEATTALLREQVRLRQAQKAETIGQLTGGVAHDFNNLLTIILGNSELLRDRISADCEAVRLLQSILDAVSRGAKLTSHLLAFARIQPLEPETLSLNQMLGDMEGMLKLTMGKGVSLEVEAAPEVFPVNVDRGQLETAIVNLAINARDAMPRGGSLRIEVRNAELALGDIGEAEDLRPGDYACLTFSDTGMGMTREVQARVFDPFFTTKEKGKGTGLGLSMVQGFAAQSSGGIRVNSTVGEGTEFSLFLPRAEERVSSRAVGKADGGLSEGRGETILLVEDEDTLRQIIAMRLSRLGYQVETAVNADQALDLLNKAAPFDLVLTDLAMPGALNGVDLVEKVLGDFPDLPVIVCSGFADGLKTLQDRVPLLQKPFRAAELSNLVRRVLDGSG